MELILFHAPGTRSVRVRKLLDLMALDYRLEFVDVKAGKGRAPEYLAVNPYGRVPALAIDGKVVVESGAIMMLLADLFPDRGFAPAVHDPARRRYVECFFTVLASLEPALLAWMEDPEAPARREAAEAELAGLERRLEGDWVVGERRSAADVLLHGELWWMQQALGPIPERFERLRGYYERHAEGFAWTAD